MEMSDREDPSSGTTEDDLDCRKVSTKIAGFTLESDSLPESPNNVAEERMARRKKRYMKRQSRGAHMDVDPTPVVAEHRESKYMDWDGAESHISSSGEDSLSDDNRGQEADDEQSDWVGYAGDRTDDFVPQQDRRMLLRTSQRTNQHQLSALQRRIERFVHDGGSGEGLELRMRDRPNSANLNRLLSKYRLEVVRRQRGAVFLRRKGDASASR